jgi:hypothetical protein
MSDAAAEEKTYTALDILAKEQGIIEEAAAVAEEGWGDEKLVSSCFDHHIYFVDICLPFNTCFYTICYITSFPIHF